MKSNAIHFFRLHSIDEIIKQFKELDYFSDSTKVMDGGKFWPENKDEYARLERIIQGHDTLETGQNIGLRGRLLAVTALRVPLGKRTSSIQIVALDLNLRCVSKNETPDDHETESRLLTLKKLVSMKPVPGVPVAKKSDAKEPVRVHVWNEVLDGSICVVAAMKSIAEFRATAPDLPEMTVAEAEHALVDVLFESGQGAPGSEARPPKPYADPLDLFLDLARAIHIEVPEEDEADAEVSGPLLGVQPGLAQYAAKGENTGKTSDVARVVRTIKQALGHSDTDEITARQNAHLVLLWGDEQTGKKSAVGDLLRDLRCDTPGPENYAFDLRDPDTHDVVKTLPVFAVLVQRVGYRDLLEFLYCFLAMRKPGAMESEKELRARARSMLQDKPNGRTLLEEIAVLHEAVPAVFIFCDVHGFARDGFQSVLQERGIFDLLARLTEKPGLSRFLITQENNNYDEWHVAPNALTCQSVEMDVPKLARFPWYPSEAVYERYQSAAFEALRSEALRQVSTKNDADNLTGNGLLTMSAYLCMQDDDERAAQDLAEYAMGGGPGRAREPERERRAQLNRRLLRCFNAARIDDVILLIAATALTQDGLNEVTLKRMLCKWRECTPVDLEPHWKRIEATLERLCIGTQELYISRRDDAAADPHEFYLAEITKRKSAKPRKIKEWRMSRGVAHDLITDIRHMDGVDETIRRAFRQVAREAQRRGQIKRLRHNGGPGQRVDPKREIQSFRALLASLPAELDPIETKAPFGNLRTKLEEVFNVDPDRSPNLALRYAIMVMLRCDIDPDHMLSMVTDQDELRLDLYLRLFKPLGDISGFSVSELRGQKAREVLPTTVSEHLHAVLNVSEILELLLTIAIAAFHSQLEEIIHWAHDIAHAMQGDRKFSAADHSTLARINCVRFDAAIQRGSLSPPSERQNKPDPLSRLRAAIIRACQNWRENYQVHPQDIDQTRTLEALFSYVEGGNTNPVSRGVQGELTFAAPAMPDCARNLKDGMRLLARFGDIAWMTQPTSREAQQNLVNFYSNLSHLEAVIARQYGDNTEPVVMSGRTGRRMVRALTQDSLVFAYPYPEAHPAPPELKTMDGLVRGILHANAQRQVRFGGADRLITLSDYARLRATDSGSKRAREILRDCEAALEDSLISLVGRLETEMMAMGADLNIATERLISKGSVGDVADLLHNRDCLARMRSQAKEHVLYPTEIALLLLSARNSYLIAHCPDDPADFAEAREEFKQCWELAEQIGFLPASSCASAWLMTIETTLPSLAGQDPV